MTVPLQKTRGTDVRGVINRVLTHSFVDGPGNRAVVFFQGCTLSCLYCHNPYTMNFCTHCGVCVPACPAGALSMLDGRVLWNTAACLECDTCIEVCPEHSSPRTRPLRVGELWELIAPHQVFLNGITASGGEPLLQPEFLSAFFHHVKEHSSLTTMIETNGSIHPGGVVNLLPVLDGAMVDFKAGSPGVYRALTGNDGQVTRDAIRWLAGQGKLHSVRQVVVPGYTDTEENARETARFLAGVDPMIPLQFLRFRPHGTAGEAQLWPAADAESMQTMVSIARSEGLQAVSVSL
jgi:pyruvate formate lyase activating enzyme